MKQGTKPTIGVWKWVLVALLLIGAVIAARLFPLLEWTKAFAQWAEHLGTPGVMLCGVVFGVTSMLMLPSIPFTIVAGFAFGMVNGVISIMVGIAIGAALGFLFARYAARGAVSQKIAANARFHLIDRAIASEGWKIVGLLRLCPVPFGITNYLYGLTGTISGVTWAQRLSACCRVASRSFMSALSASKLSLARDSRFNICSAD